LVNLHFIQMLKLYSFIRKKIELIKEFNIILIGYVSLAKIFKNLIKFFILIFVNYPLKEMFLKLHNYIFKS